MKMLLVAVGVIAFFFSCSCDGAIFHADGNTGILIDKAGRQRFFRGVNVIYKGDPWHPTLDKFDPETSFVDKDMDDLKEWGFNAVRLGIMWPGVEPQQNVFNESYLAVMQNITLSLADRGIFTLLDFHQDCLAASFCGEGIPEWAVVVKDNAMPFPEPAGRPFSREKKPPIPSAADCSRHQWAEYQATSAASSAYEYLYTDTWVRAAFVKFWQKVASSFTSSSSSSSSSSSLSSKINDFLLGYEIMNEPFPGDVYAHPSLLIPSVADRERFAPFYDAVAAGIRQVDKDNLIFFEPLTFDDVAFGLSSVPGGPEFANKSVLSYHYYLPPNLGVEEAFSHHVKDAKKLNCAGFLTEFDLCKDEKHMLHVLDAADEHLFSWTGWEYKSFIPITGVCAPFYNQSAGGILNEERVRLLSRSYPTAVAGEVVTLKFDHVTSVMTLVFRTNPAIDEPTLIYYNARLRYPNGVKIVLEPATAGTAAVSDRNEISIVLNRDVPSTLLTVTLSPA